MPRAEANLLMDDMRPRVRRHSQVSPVRSRPSGTRSGELLPVEDCRPGRRRRGAENVALVLDVNRYGPRPRPRRGRKECGELRRKTDLMKWKGAMAGLVVVRREGLGIRSCCLGKAFPVGDGSLCHRNSTGLPGDYRSLMKFDDGPVKSRQDGAATREIPEVLARCHGTWPPLVSGPDQVHRRAC
jgi:hypothetical protein